MRPAILAPLFAGVTALPRIGSRTAKALARLLPLSPTIAEPRVIDLLWHWPYRLIDRRHRPLLDSLSDGALATVTVTVGEHDAPPRGSRRPYRVHVFDETGDLALVFFHAKSNYLSGLLPPGSKRIVSGRVEERDGAWQMVHPDHVVKPDDAARIPPVEPVYPLTEGLSNRMLTGAIAASLERVPELEEWQDRAWLKKQGWPTFHDAVARVHALRDRPDLEPMAPARARLAFDELLASQLSLSLLRRHRRRLGGRSIDGTGTLSEAFTAALPFALTGGQKTVLAEIRSDMAAPEQMVRLLQGDVGSGKTMVAALAMLTAVESGAQAALMAPTEILARQHFTTLAPLFSAIGLRAALLTGREKGSTRTSLLDELATGAVPILIGTHALFQDDVVFEDLALAVIDEQHRFGVHQRMALQAKSAAGAADLLVMTATPIPRTLVLTHYGNMDVSRLTERPPGRGRVETRAMPVDRVNEILARLEGAVANGARIYWVCPQIDSEGADGSATAIARHTALVDRFGEQVVLAHGRMAARERDTSMKAFKEGGAAILVATTVIEVGVDVPEATIMVIEDAERFGLAQLHQLRGRVGRGGRDAACVLLFTPPLSDVAAARLAIMRETDDGFRIAEEDLRLRGGGEVLGTRQSGMPGFRIADPLFHADLIEPARDQAELILSRTPSLKDADNHPVRALMYLFERDEAFRLIGAG